MADKFLEQKENIESSSSYHVINASHQPEDQKIVIEPHQGIEKSKFCYNCGSELDSSELAKFCALCGSAIQ